MNENILWKKSLLKRCVLLDVMNFYCVFLLFLANSSLENPFQIICRMIACIRTNSTKCFAYIFEWSWNYRWRVIRRLSKYTKSERNLISINLIVDILRTVISNQIDLKIGMNEFRENCIDAIEIISIIIDPAGSFFSNLVNISFVGMNSTVLSSKIVSSKQCLRIGIFICGRQRHLYNN